MPAIYTKDWYEELKDLLNRNEEVETTAAGARREAGPLAHRSRRLVKLAISVGARLEGAVRSHSWQAREAGVTDAEMDHVVLLSLTTIGLPSMVAARTWVASALAEA